MRFKSTVIDCRKLVGYKIKKKAAGGKCGCSVED